MTSFGCLSGTLTPYDPLMRVMGIAVQQSTKGRPDAVIVVLEGSWSAPTFVDSFKLASSADELPAQLDYLSSGLRSRLTGLALDRVVIRRADWSSQAKKE